MKKIALISSYCDTEKKIEILKNNILILKKIGIDTLVISPITLTSEIIELSEKESSYRTGIREGIVIKHANGRFCDKMYKVVNKLFQRREGFNEELIKNCLVGK